MPETRPGEGGNLFKDQITALIVRLKDNPVEGGAVIARSFEELYNTDEFADVLFDTMSDEEYRTQTAALAWRFIIRQGNDIVAPIVSVTPPKKTPRILQIMENVTQTMPQHKDDDFAKVVEASKPLAVEAVQGIGLQTLAVMQVSEHLKRHNYVVDMSYPKIYREIQQLDVHAEILGKPNPHLKLELGASLGSEFLRALPIGTVVLHI